MRTITQAIQDLGINRTQFYQLMDELEIETEDQGNSKIIDDENFQKLFEAVEKKFVSSKIRRYETKMREIQGEVEVWEKRYAELMSSKHEEVSKFKHQIISMEDKLKNNYAEFQEKESQLSKKYVSEIKLLENKLNESAKEKESISIQLSKIKEENIKFQIYKENYTNSSSEISFFKEQIKYFQEENKNLRSQLIKNEHLISDLENKEFILEKMLSISETNLEKAQDDKDKLFQILHSKSTSEDSLEK